MQARPRSGATHLGVIATEQAVVSCPDTRTLAVPVAATLGGAVAADKAEVAATVVRLHARAVDAALSTHRAAQPCHTAGWDRSEAGWGLQPTTHRPCLHHPLPDQGTAPSAPLTATHKHLPWVPYHDYPLDAPLHFLEEDHLQPSTATNSSPPSPPSPIGGGSQTPPGRQAAQSRLSLIYPLHSLLTTRGRNCLYSAPDHQGVQSRLSLSYPLPS